MSAADFIRVPYDDPHISRARRMLAAHPELRDLAGPYPPSAVWIAVLVTVQLSLAFVLLGQPWYVWLPIAYIVGATIDHALWVLIHECAHNLVFRAPAGNKIAAIVANLPLVLPSAMSFCKYHLLHHKHLGNQDLDADLPGETEARMIGASAARKAGWLALFAVIIGAVRPIRLARVPVVDRWTVINAFAQFSAMAVLWVLAGPEPFKYLFASAVLAIGLHPIGARWIQEHYVITEGQETYSYYGLLNTVAFNVGYHNEHHDLMSVPWRRLPRIPAIAPEFYRDLTAHRSCTTVLVSFLTDRRLTLFRRIVRGSNSSRASRASGVGTRGPRE
ncbi:MAG TPA: fatty acid desaturase [Vicinamibacterales bacterium]|nr:fatty acid desaturase [Vicinamibacterales bacterium]